MVYKSARKILPIPDCMMRGIAYAKDEKMIDKGKGQ